jgi:hypothetical protein
MSSFEAYPCDGGFYCPYNTALATAKTLFEEALGVSNLIDRDMVLYCLNQDTTTCVSG